MRWLASNYSYKDLGKKKIIMLNLQPTECNICGGTVIYTSNKVIYGKEYGSGRCYYCTNCGAYVGTHKPRPDEAFGLLATKEMRDMKMKCHTLFDEKWKNEPTSKKRYIARRNAYLWLADQLKIPIENCHFGYFDMSMLNKAYQILNN